MCICICIEYIYIYIYIYIVHIQWFQRERIQVDSNSGAV
jgi:hypothetical protein